MCDCLYPSCSWKFTESFSEVKNPVLWSEVILSPYRWRNKLGKFVSFNPDCWKFTMDVSQALMCVHVANILVVLGLIPSPIVKMKSEREAKGIIWE